MDLNIGYHDLHFNDVILLYTDNSYYTKLDL